MNKERSRLHKAVDAFAKAMKLRLDEKADAGYTGWDGAYPACSLRSEILSDAEEMREFAESHKAVDIANRCMMLWYRGCIDMSSKLKHGDKVTLELRSWSTLWRKVEGEIVEESGELFLKHRDVRFRGAMPEHTTEEGYCYWWLNPNKGATWRFPQQS
jgi:hypothetical protein